MIWTIWKTCRELKGLAREWALASTIVTPYRNPNDIVTPIYPPKKDQSTG